MSRRGFLQSRSLRRISGFGGLARLRRQRARRHQYGNQDRADDALQRATLAVDVRTNETAYFRMINEQGGVNGRKLNLISLDDAYSPPKTVEQVRDSSSRSRSRFWALSRRLRLGSRRA